MGGPDGAGVEAAPPQAFGRFEGRPRLAQHQRHDGGGGRGQAESLREAARVAEDRASLRVGFAADGDRTHERAAHRRERRRGVDEGPRPLEQVIAQHSAADHQASGDPEGLPARHHARHHPRGRRGVQARHHPGSGRAEQAEGVGLVHDEPRVVALAQRVQLADRRGVAVHGEDALGHDEPAARTAGLAQARLDLGEVEVAVDEGPRATAPDAVDQGRVQQGVGDDRVAPTGEGAEQTEVGLIAAREEERGLSPQPVGDALLRPCVQRGAPSQEPRRPRADAVLLQAAAHRLEDERMAREAEVVVRDEVRACVVAVVQAAQQAGLLALAQLVREDILQAHGIRSRRAARRAIPASRGARRRSRAPDWGSSGAPHPGRSSWLRRESKGPALLPGARCGRPRAG